MKKAGLAGLLGGIMILAMTGCGKNTTAETTVSETAVENTSNAAEKAEKSEETSESADVQERKAAGSEAMQNAETAQKAEATDTEGSPILVAYFSWSGNTEKIASMIAEDTGADLFEIEPVEAYPEDYNAVVDQAKEEQSANVRPELLHDVETFQKYDVIFLGYPNWWSDVPMIMNTFMEAHDFNGKTVIPFCTHGGGGFGKSLASVKAGTAGATVLDGFSVNGNQAGSAADDVKTWIDSLNLEK